MKIMQNMFKKILLLGLLVLSFNGFAQNFTVSLANGSNPTSTTFEVDIVLNVLPASGVRLSSVAFGVNYNTAILNGGTPSTAQNGGTWTMIAGSRSPEVAGLNATTNTNRVLGAGPASAGHLRATMSNLVGSASIDIAQGTYTIGRYRFTNTVPFTQNSNANLWLQPTNAGGNTNTIVSFYPFGAATPLGAATTTSTGANSSITLSHSAASTFSLPLNAVQDTCFESGSFAQTAPSCLGNSDGSATITMSPVPTSLSATYSLNGAAAVPVTLSATGQFTISGLAAGSYTLAVTGSGTPCSSTTVSVPFTVNAGANPTFNPTSVTACDTYTWANNGQTYTASGTYDGTTTNCVTEQLVLTITPSSNNTTSVTECNTYTWANTGQTYTASGTYTGTTTNCVTEVLNLTITPGGFNTTTASACDTYTWAANGQTYTASGTYTGATVDCVTDQLVLTITPSSTNTTAASACDTYTWANNGQTYTASGTYTGTTTNCVTEQLELTITPSSTNTTTASACDTYTWASNGQTYTASGTYTGATVNCVTDELVLTITPSSTNTTTASACDTYTWANNGQTYTASGTYTGTTTNCVTEELVLTITPSSFNTTTATACDTYTWAANGQTYTASGTYTGATANCVTEQLELTITPSSTNTTTASACDSYTWAANGQTYTASGTYTGATVNCVTDQLVLTITGPSVNSTAVTACGSYTWANNGQTYTASGTYTGTTTNCVTEELVLTIEANPTTTENVAICAGGSYTWAANGQTYTEAGTYTAVIPFVQPAPYCPAGSLTIGCDTGDEFISNVTIGTINNASGCAASGNYQDFTAQSTDVVAGSSYPISITNGNSFGGDQARVWADWNQDGDFTDSGEEYLLTYAATTTGSIAVPAGAFNGATRMRVRVTYTGAFSSCGNTSFGEVEDYTLNVSGGAPYSTCDTNATLVVTVTPTPAGDELATAIDANGLTSTVTGNNLSSNCFSNTAGTTRPGNDVWYKVTLEDCAATLSVNTCGTGSNFDSYIAVYAADGTTILGFNDDSCPESTFGLSQLDNLDVSAHDVVYVLVDAWSAGDQGNFVLDLSQTLLSVTPTFTQVAPICSGGSFTLPATSDNGITGTWAPAIDNSATTEYTFTPDAGQCASATLTTMTVVVTPSTFNTTTATACDTYTWAANGTTYTASGTYTGATVNCVTDQLVLTINNSTSSTMSATACDTYTWSANGTTYTASGTYTNVTTNAAGCTDTATLELTINNSTSSTMSATACDTYTWSANGATYSASGTYTNVTTNAAGCPDTATLVLTINNSTSSTMSATACDSYTWAANGTTYTASGTYTNVTTNAAGCPDTATLELTINNSTSSTMSVTACDTYTWAANGTTYSASGTYTNVTTNAAGCTDTATLELTINNSTSSTMSVTACDTYTWAANGTTYSASGTYTNVTTNAAGCTDTATLELTINNSTSSSMSATACDSYTWAANGTTYTASGTYTNVTTNAAGCTDTATLVLTINNSTTNGSLTTSAVNSYTWNGPLGSGLTYTASGVYTFTTTNAAGCPNVATLNLTITTGVVTVNTFNIGTSCGATISSLSVTIIAAAVPGASTYTFRITNLATSTSFVVNRPVNSFALSSYAGITLGTAYQIEVSVNGGANYGAPCIVNTPAPTSTIGAQCGTTLTSMGQFVYATYVGTVTGYRFEVTNLTSNAVQVYDALSGQNRFTFNQLSAAIRAFGTTYSVRVALRNTDGNYLPYGASCNITTPAFPTSEVILSQCDTVATSNTQTISAVVVSGATDYRFQLVNSSLPYSFSIDRPINNFNLSMFPGLQSGTTYTVRVAVRIGGVWGPLTGKPCNITTPGVAVGGTREIADKFVAVAYPNPFAENFMFNVTTTADSTIQIRVYDMLGKQVENRNVEVNAIDSLQVGDSYPSGVYNVIVSQGANTQTLRVIKR